MRQSQRGGADLHCRDCFMQANKFSGEVAHAKAVVRDREASFPPGEVDEEDQELLAVRAQLRAIKDGAREAREAYTRHGAEAEELLAAVADARRQLMDAFEAWFEDEGAFLGEVCSHVQVYLFSCPLKAVTAEKM